MKIATSLFAFFGAALLLSPALAQMAPPPAKSALLAQSAPADEEAEQDQQPPVLSVGALALGGDPSLSAPSVSIDIGVDKVTYAYALKNAGAAPLELAGAVAFSRFDPGRQSNGALPRDNAENPVDLAVTLGDAQAQNMTPVATTAHVRATALGVNRVDDLKAAQLPLLPFGPELEAALAKLAPEAADRLARQGLLAPRDADPKKPAAREAAWTLDVTQAFKLTLPPNATSMVNISFTPIKAVFPVTRNDIEGLDPLKEDLCLSAKTLTSLRARLTSGGEWQATEMSIDAGPPNEWIEAPAAAVSVRKPRPDAIVGFCGASEKSETATMIAGASPQDSRDNMIHIMIFIPTGK